MIDLAIVIPLKDFEIAKKRLRIAGITDVGERVRELARGVIAASQPRHVIVVTEAPDVAAFAYQNGAEPHLSGARDLNEAVQLAYRTLEHRFDCVLIAHGDLASPEGLGAFAPGRGITIVTDRQERGTNVLALPTGLDFHFSYGPDSKDAHVAEAKRLGVECRIVTKSPWADDIDEPADLEED
jgi:2-phospho-L-lactate guanylyltransferase